MLKGASTKLPRVVSNEASALVEVLLLVKYHGPPEAAMCNIVQNFPSLDLILRNKNLI